MSALAALADGDPVDALRNVHDESGPEVELLRAAAWAALGDLVASGDAIGRSTMPVLEGWARFGTGDRSDGIGALAAGDDRTDGPAALVRAIANWVASGRITDDLVADLGRASLGFRIDPDAARWPVSPDSVGTLIADRLGAAASAERTIAAAVSERPGGAPHDPGHRLLAAWLDARRGMLDTAAAVVDEFAEVDLSPRDRFLRRGRALRGRRPRRRGVRRRCRSGRRDRRGRAASAPTSTTSTSSRRSRRRRGAPGSSPSATCSRRTTRSSNDWARLPACATTSPGRAFGPRWRATTSTTCAWWRPKLRTCSTHGRRTTPRRWCHRRRRRSPAAWPVSSSLPSRRRRPKSIAIAQHLADTGAPFEAARLCGLVATASGDERVARALLKESRHWRATRSRLRNTAGIDHAVVRLSDQEERVARMVIDGHTHKQIGAALFVSPKTVEHHVAHIRTKLGCADRAAMMSSLREYLAAV